MKLLAKSTKVYNWWAMAAEIRITSAAEATTDTEVVDKSGLTDALAEAKALNEADYTAESWAVLQTKIEAAEAVVNNADATNYDVQLALANLVEQSVGWKQRRLLNRHRLIRTNLQKLSIIVQD